MTIRNESIYLQSVKFQAKPCMRKHKFPIMLQSYVPQDDDYYDDGDGDT